MNAHEFVDWFGIGLEDLINAGNEQNRFFRGRNLVSETIKEITDLSEIDRIIVLEMLIESHMSRKIGGFQIPFDDRDKSDAIEEIIATIEAFLEK